MPLFETHERFEQPSLLPNTYRPNLDSRETNIMSVTTAFCNRTFSIYEVANTVTLMGEEGLLRLSPS